MFALTVLFENKNALRCRTILPVFPGVVDFLGPSQPGAGGLFGLDPKTGKFLSKTQLPLDVYLDIETASNGGCPRRLVPSLCSR